MFRKMLLGLSCFACCVVLQGQDPANPFELLHRLPKSVLPFGGGVPPDLNPFDVVPHRVPSQSSAMAENQTEAFNPFAVLPKGGGLSGNILVGLLLAAFAFLTFSIAANRSSVSKAWGGFLTENGFSVVQREASGFVGITPYYLLYVNFLFNAGIFLFLVTRVFHNETYNNLPFLLLCLAGASVAFLSKHIVLALVRGLFPVDTEIQKYNFLILIFNCILGLFLVPFNVFIAFSTKSGAEQLILVSWMLGLVAILYTYRIIRAGQIGAKFLAQSPFHFLLYLCTVEIAPVLVLLKIALMQTT